MQIIKKLKINLLMDFVNKNKQMFINDINKNNYLNYIKNIFNNNYSIEDAKPIINKIKELNLPNWITCIDNFTNSFLIDDIFEIYDYIDEIDLNHLLKLKYESSCKLFSNIPKEGKILGFILSGDEHWLS